ncbi:hypothetical protein ACHAP4_011153 [Fusarium culmorum]
MLGFGRTRESCQLSLYGLRSLAEDVKDLAEHVAKDKKIILGGHDWGATLVWRTALWFPDLVQGIFSVGTPFIPPTQIYRSLDDVTRSEHMKNLRYQLQFQGTHISDEMTDEPKIRQFLNAMFGGRGPQDQVGFDPSRGIIFHNLPRLNRSRLLSDVELEYYVCSYFQNGKSNLEGPLRWYRTQAQNYLDELRLLLKPVKFSIPALFLTPTLGEISSAKMTEKMDRYFDNLTSKEVDGSLWMLWESPAAVNEQISTWLKKMVV